MTLRDLLSTAADFVTSLTPSLIGSAVSQFWKPALSFRERFLQWVVGSTVSYFATNAITALTSWHGFVAQAIAFGVGLIAVDATPRVSRAVIDTLSSLPERLANKFLPRKD